MIVQNSFKTQRRPQSSCGGSASRSTECDDLSVVGLRDSEIRVGHPGVYDVRNGMRIDRHLQVIVCDMARLPEVRRTLLVGPKSASVIRPGPDGIDWKM